MSNTTTSNADALRTFQLVITEEDAKPIWESHGEAIIRHTLDTGNALSASENKPIGPDTLILAGNHEVLINGQKIDLPKGGWPIKTTFFPLPDGIGCMIGEQPKILTAHPDIPNISEWLQFIQKRNTAAGLGIPVALKTALKEPVKPASKTDSFPVQTSQEMEVLMRSACHGKSGFGWQNVEQRRARVFEIKGASHRVDVFLRDERTGEEMTWEAITKLTSEQNSDFPIMAFYIFGILAPPDVLPENRLAGAWIDLNDVLGKIGWLASKPKEAAREELRKQLYEFLRFGACAVVTGTRSIPYRDTETKEEIPTRIESAPWRIMEIQRPEQSVLFGEDLPAPTRVYLAVPKEWETLLTHSNLAQYLPLGEILGAIPPNKVAGDWARGMGIYLAREWRMDLHGALAGKVKLTRRELLTHYTPKTRTVDDLLESRDPSRAVKYYIEALNILFENGLIAPVGDAAKGISHKTMIKQYGGYGWAKRWLDDESGLQLGTQWQPTIEQLGAKKFIPKSKNLKALPKRHKAKNND